MGLWRWLGSWIVSRRLKADLARAEEQLGLYGWHVAHFDTVFQPTLVFIRDLESAQVDLLNGNADLASEIAGIDSEMSRAIAEHGSAREELRAVEAASPVPPDVREARQRVEGFVRAVREMDQEIGALVEERNSLMLSKKPGVDVRIRIIMGQVTRLKAEREDLDLQRKLWQSKIYSAHKKVREEEAAIRDARKRYRATQRALLRELTALRKKRSRLLSQKSISTREFDRAEAYKSGAYRRLGRVLADNAIAPPNQPELLELVHSLREQLEAMKTGVRS